MPKLKTHKTTAKRIKTSARGKLLRRHAFQNHFLQKKSSSRKRQYKKDHEVDDSSKKKIKRALGL